MSKYYKDIVGVMGMMFVLWALFLSGCSMSEEDFIDAMDAGVAESLEEHKIVTLESTNEVID